MLTTQELNKIKNLLGSVDKTDPVLPHELVCQMIDCLNLTYKELMLVYSYPSVDLSSATAALMQIAAQMARNNMQPQALKMRDILDKLKNYVHNLENELNKLKDKSI